MDVSNNNITIETTEEFQKFRKIIHNMRNMFKMTEEEIIFIQTLDEEKKMEIIKQYDKIVQTLVETLHSNF